MKKIIVFLLFLFYGSLVLTGNVVALPDLKNPRKVAVDENQMYITEGTTVYIYSLKDFKLVKKFGREGEGPREFKRRIRSFSVHPEYLFFNSAGKVSYFTKDGNFIKELNTLSSDMILKPFRKGFIGGRTLVENKTLYFSVGIYNEDLKMVKTLFKQEREVQLGGKGARVFAHPLPYYLFEDKIFFTAGKEFNIQVLDKTGEKIHSIIYDTKKIKVSENVKKRVIKFLKTDPETKPYFEMIKPIIFPQYFPAIRHYYITDGYIYVITYKRKGDKSECFIFDIVGEFLKKMFIEFEYINPVDEYPATVKNKKLYQLVENSDTEEWELHIHKIK